MIPALKLKPGLLPESGQVTLGGVPEGMTALVLGRLVEENQLLYIASDEAEAERLLDALRYFAPKAELLYFPPWDCLPYDRVSPSAGVVSQRLSTLYRLTQQPVGQRITVTTVAATLLKVLPRHKLEQSGLTAKAGGVLDGEKLQAYLVLNGYLRVDTVREPGEFARRGGLFDLFPAGRDQPLRIDLFGDTIESIRSFDPLTQMTTGNVGELSLLPATEFSMDEDSVGRFRQAYRETFGAVLDDDTLYDAVSEGRRHPGMEHWLPFFYAGLDSIFDYTPGVPLVLAPQTEEAIDARLAHIADYFIARQEMQQVDRKAGAPLYKPVPSESLYLDRAHWERYRNLRPCAQVMAFTPPDCIDLGGRMGRNFADVRSKPNVDLLDVVVEHIEDRKKQRKQVLLAGYTEGSRDRLVHMLAEHGEENVDTIVLPLDYGFETPDLAIITEADIFGERLSRPQKKRKQAANFIAEASSLATGDLVVHVDHGLGRYHGLETITVGGAPHDCLMILYAGDDKLFVPVENIDVLTRYGDSETAQLDKLGGTAWQGRKAKVKKKLLDMAAALMRIAAERATRKADQLTPPEGLYEEFCARFPYAETDDQLKAIEDVLEDLHSGRPMDRLVCGDVGFGKTEVALRAAFVAAACGYQVALIAPTTLLVRQHYKNFVNRFAGMPLRIAQLSRLVNAKDMASNKKELEEGKVDIIVGTHALLAKNVKFHNLGLVIVDEEQHFGVKQKERLKELRHEVHVLTLTATPIPRTLQLSLAGVREMSLITTPPVDRLAVRSFVMPFDPLIVKEALMREHFRGGQSFFVCPRLSDLPKITERLDTLVPDLKYITAHGQMPAEQLEQVMTDFYAGKYDILLATNIIESGLDIPNANTMIIHRADLFGLAQLYQLRGRVGRGKQRGYAYLTYLPNMLLSATAKRRLEVMSTLDSLGAGFTLASHDMDIRGGGNLLGEEQSGHIKEVGVELYQHMLEEAVAEVKAGGADKLAANAEWQPQINLGIPVLIPEAYVPELGVRLGLYRRLADLESQEEIEGFGAELVDRFGKLPPEVANLMAVIGIKQHCRKAGIDRYDAGPKGAVVTFHDNKHPNPGKLVEYLSRQGGALKLRPDHKLVAMRAWDDQTLRLKGSQRLLKELVETAN